MTSKAEKKRRKKAMVAHPFDVAPVPRREANGQPDRKGKPRAASAMALDVRCSHHGERDSRTASNVGSAP